VFRRLTSATHRLTTFRLPVGVNPPPGAKGGQTGPNRITAHSKMTLRGPASGIEFARQAGPEKNKRIE